MNDITQRLQDIKSIRANRKNEDRLVSRIEKLSKQRDKQQKILQNIEAKIESSFEELENIGNKGE
ncbi:hypothetical protein LS66_009110 [Helicobacter sp. MIT 03-1614]|uniref:hypothetical protein n=1 Tax=Helicobacter TaxID=209 RepID=UPI00051385AF|nr:MULTISPECIES: hypothetical protein [Helicobacter]QOQ91991.1 hypothetical protein HW260_11505 [Helicobacter cinaedi]TLD86698.1 hypothetical protein LS66_009110 [Helicobacter sp. MIT 03-1614]BDB65790.1 hypothetical protein T36_2269 [Helicobacter cinaedi]